MHSPTLYLHVGIYKTGSTSLQCFLRRGRQELLKQTSTLYPNSGRPQTRFGTLMPGHHRLAWYLKDKNGVTNDSCWKEIQHEIKESGVSRVVISSEDFCGMSLEEIEKLASYTSSMSPVIVLYIRNPVSWLISAYKERVKSGTTVCALREFVLQYSGNVDFLALMQRWSRNLSRPLRQLRRETKVSLTRSVPR